MIFNKLIYNQIHVRTLCPHTSPHDIIAILIINLNSKNVLKNIQFSDSHDEGNTDDRNIVENSVSQDDDDNEQSENDDGSSNENSNDNNNCQSQN